MVTPSFTYMGGKSRLRKWLVSHFPTTGRRYVEPFVGRGNVFFHARQYLNFNEWHLSDIDVSFFTALFSADLNDLPNEVTKEDFQNWKQSTSPIAKVIEPRVTFGGKGYKSGYNGHSGTHVGYNGECYRKVCTLAKELLCTANIKQISWAEALDECNENDFVYLDPPYTSGKTPYPNIDHEALVKSLNSAKFRWALSGYGNELYKRSLNFKSEKIKERNSEIKSSNKGSYQAISEHLWTNF